MSEFFYEPPRSEGTNQPTVTITSPGQVPEPVLAAASEASPVMAAPEEELREHPPHQTVLQHNQGVAPNTVTTGVPPISRTPGQCDRPLAELLQGLQPAALAAGGPEGCTPTSGTNQQQQKQQQWEDLFPETEGDAVKGSDATYY